MVGWETLNQGNGHEALRTVVFPKWNGFFVCLFVCLPFFFKLTLLFRSVLGSQYNEFAPAGTFPPQPLALSTFQTRLECLLKLKNLHRHVVITQRLYFTLGFTLSFVHCVNFEKCVKTCSHHYSIKRSSFSALGILVFCLLIPPFLPLTTCCGILKCGPC